MSKIHLHGPGHGAGNDTHDPDDGVDGGQQRSPWPGRLELIITVALGLAVIVGAFAAFKNEQRNHSATADFSTGVRNFDDSGQFYATFNTEFTHNQALFLEYAKAIQQSNAQLARYIFNNLMDSSLQAAV